MSISIQTPVTASPVAPPKPSTPPASSNSTSSASSSGSTPAAIVNFSAQAKALNAGQDPDHDGK